MKSVAATRAHRVHHEGAPHLSLASTAKEDGGQRGEEEEAEEEGSWEGKVAGKGEGEECKRLGEDVVGIGPRALLRWYRSFALLQGDPQEMGLDGAGILHDRFGFGKAMEEYCSMALNAAAFGRRSTSKR